MDNNKKRDFDTAAAAWDENPHRVRLAEEVATAIKEQLDLTPALHVADFGCGTGLLSFQLQPLVHSLTGIDSSQGMLKIFQEKVEQLGLTNVHTLLVDLDKGDKLTGSYNLVVSNMTLHHIRDLSQLLKQIYMVLTPGGTACLTDLDLEGGLFHEDNTGVFHFGFDRLELRESLAEAGFIDIRDTTATEIIKPGKNGEERRFTVFLITGRKKEE